jgi:L-serine dehydratase
MGGSFDEVLVEFDANGSLATTHASQGSDMGLFGGLLGWEATDERLAGSAGALAAAGVGVRTVLADLGATHPSTYRLTLRNADGRHVITAISTGGGMIEVTEIDGAAVALAGDCFATLLFLDGGGDRARDWLAENMDADEVNLFRTSDGWLVEMRTPAPPAEAVLAELRSRFAVRQARVLAPVLPVLSRKGGAVPFLTCEEMLRWNAGRNLALWELAVEYESARGALPPAQVVARMRAIAGIMEGAIAQGLRGTEHADRILGCQSGAFSARLSEGRLLDGGMLNRIILYVAAMMEVKSALGVIVAAPTAGSCGGLPGACLGAGHALGLSQEELARALLAAGLIGVFIAARSTFAAEVCGCQAECGSSSGMAAAGLVTLANGTLPQALGAASLALQSMLGLVCDPVANRVEVPCLGKNVLAASNAFACANMALADFDPVIPLDEVIDAMDRVGKSLPSELRCTGRGGLSVTQTSQEIEKRLGGSCAR